MSRLRMFLLGAPRLEHGRAPTKLGRRKSLGPLIYLAVTQREHAREKLATLLWPDATEAQSRQALRTALADIRRAVGEDHIVSNTDGVAFNPTADSWMDLQELDKSVVSPLAIAPFLEGFNLKGAPDFNDWASFERDRLLQLSIRHLRARADAHQARGELSEAIAAAQQLLGLDPLHEETHRQLMQLYYATGDRAAALRQYETARAALERDLGVEPMEEAQQIKV